VKVLQSTGLDVQAASSGAEAIALWETWHPHLIWMDMRMSDMDGLETVRQIRKAEQARADDAAQQSGSSPKPCVIIALTAQVFTRDLTTALAVGCNDFVTKPIEEATIFAKMAEHLGLCYLYAETAEAAQSQTLAERSPTLIYSVQGESHAPSYSQVQDAEYLLSPPDLNIMPAEWIVALQLAAQNCDDEEIYALLQHIPSKYEVLKSNLYHLTHNYRFEAIVRLISNPDE
jgi:CheY-like chemotaxis protein